MKLAMQYARLIKCFVKGTTARAASELVGIQANRAIRFLMMLRQIICQQSVKP
jgi:hypothetical protein